MKINMVDYYEKIGYSVLWIWSWARGPGSDVEWAELQKIMSIHANQNTKSGTDPWKWLSCDDYGFVAKQVRLGLQEALGLSFEDRSFKGNS
ncbi:hypothetical protein HanRHA438_Chr08g0329271 [Helianthus annuus]|nr:hypothetical protein HanIR_Chr12g0584151 [Helianthus annuus]KAJ0895974.1 hypothetical protein HanRHA438_Chr08g0329271 [Helianthus annuus]